MRSERHCGPQQVARVRADPVRRSRGRRIFFMPSRKLRPGAGVCCRFGERSRLPDRVQAFRLHFGRPAILRVSASRACRRSFTKPRHARTIGLRGNTSTPRLLRDRAPPLAGIRSFAKPGDQRRRRDRVLEGSVARSEHPDGEGGCRSQASGVAEVGDAPGTGRRSVEEKIAIVFSPER